MQMRRFRIGPLRRNSRAAGEGPDASRASLPPSDEGVWEAIVAQLRATSSGLEPWSIEADNEYAWARRLGMHINRGPTGG
jgi:hypothetical protein